ncbi:MAG: tRNA pseudouridine synthase A, partial [Succinivibrio dextrinosolvens]|nr:tRNA pseudouridine synthase A [Succinivibrio dextrinosolvens]
MRIALGIEYEGSNYAGFQRQSTLKTVQGELERALSIIADEEIQLQCAGRTDAGVNATGQVVHFDVIKERPDRGWVMGTNNNLPNDIAVTWAKHVDDSFHARFSAKARRYRYIIQNTLYRSGILSKGVSVYQGDY